MRFLMTFMGLITIFVTFANPALAVDIPKELKNTRECRVHYIAEPLKMDFFQVQSSVLRLSYQCDRNEEQILYFKRTATYNELESHSFLTRDSDWSAHLSSLYWDQYSKLTTKLRDLEKYLTDAGFKEKEHNADGLQSWQIYQK